jgi:YesN/AraC family two-component response regulator
MMLTMFGFEVVDKASNGKEAMKNPISSRLNLM